MFKKLKYGSFMFMTLFYWDKPSSCCT